MIHRMLNKNLDKYRRLIKFYQILKNAKRMIHMVLKVLKWEGTLALNFQTLIAYLKDFSEVLHLTIRMIKTFLADFWVGETKMEKEVLVLGLCLMMIYSKTLEKWVEEWVLARNLDLMVKNPNLKELDLVSLVQ